MYLEVFLWTERKTEKFLYDLKEKIKISEISKFSILPYTQDRKLRNLGNFVYLEYDTDCNSRFKKAKKNELRQKLKGSNMT